MKNQKEISTLVGIIIIIVVVLVLFGGVFAYQYFSNYQSPIVSVQPNPDYKNSKTEMVVESSHQPILDANKNIDSNVFIFGDIDGDGIDEAAIPNTVCGASCSSFVTVFKYYQGKVLSVNLSDTFVSGAAASIDSIKISNGLVIATVSDFDGTRTNSYKVELTNGKLQAQKIN